MKSFTIYIQFRRQRVAATVHEFDSFYLVGFTNDDILQDFGGQLEFDKDRNYKAGAKSLPKDSVDLFRSIKEGIKVYSDDNNI